MIWTIASRELSTRARSRSFQVVTAIMFIAVVGIAIALSFLDGNDEAREVAIGLEGDGIAYRAVLEAGDDDLDPTVSEPTDAEAELDDGTIDVVFDGQTLTWAGGADPELDSYIRSAAQQQALASRAEGLGLDDSDLGFLFQPIEIDEVRLDGGEQDLGVRLATAAAVGITNFMLIQIWGAYVLMGVIEEKSSKVIEVLLSHVRPVTLLAGKLLGLGIMAIGQMLIVLLGLIIGLSLIDIDIPADVWATVPLFALSFLLGFAFYATAFAAAGSMVSRQEDAQSVQLPVMLPLLVAYFIATASFGFPDNLAVTIGSFLPFSSPVLLPFRVALTDMAGWEVALSLAFLAISIVVMLQLASSVYRYSLLRIGRRVTWSEAWGNRRQKDLV